MTPSSSIIHHLYSSSSSWINNLCFLVGENIKELHSEEEDEAGESAHAPSPVSIHTPSTPQPGRSPRLRNQSLRIHTAPPSPMQTRHVLEIPQGPPVELAKQESLDELRSTVQLAASSMESNTKDIKLLGEKMAAATERMSETVQDNSQALVLLSRVVDRLQMLLTSNRTDVDAPAATAKPADAEEDSTPKKNQTPKRLGQRPSLTHQPRCSLPSPSSSSSSSSLSSCRDAPSTSKGTRCPSASRHGSPGTILKKPKNSPSPQKKHVNTELQASKHPLNNGLSEESKKKGAQAAKGGRSNQRKKKKKKET